MCSGETETRDDNSQDVSTSQPLNMGQPDALSPPKAEKALQLLHRRSSAKDREKSLDSMAAS